MEKLEIPLTPFNIAKKISSKATAAVNLTGEQHTTLPLKATITHDIPLSSHLFNVILEVLARAI